MTEGKVKTVITRGLALLGAGGTALAVYATRVEPRWLRVVRLRLAVPNLPPAFEGYCLVHVADLHLGLSHNDTRLPALIEAVQAERPDLIAITGDFFAGQADNPVACCRSLANLYAPDGVLGCLGNHDFTLGPRLVCEAVQQANVQMLVNAHHVVRRGGQALVFAGVDDVYYGQPDLGAALAGAPDAPVILLAHEPDYARAVVANPRVTLMLSGHTHAGQVRLPGIGALMLPSLGHLYDGGSYQLGALALYVTAGVGTGRIAVRFNCRPEIAVITLTRLAPELPAR